MCFGINLKTAVFRLNEIPISKQESGLIAEAF